MSQNYRSEEVHPQSGAPASSVSSTKPPFCLLPGERVRGVLMPGSGTLTLSTHRVRYNAQHIGSGCLMSILLTEVASCAVTRRSKPILLVIAALIAAIMLFVLPTIGRMMYVGGETTGAGFLIALCFVAAYFITQKQVVEIASSGGTSIRVNAAGMKMEMVRDFIDATESAKNALRDS